MSCHLRTWLAVAAIAGTAAAVAVVPALAADQTINATTSNTWNPSTVTVNAGRTVRFSNSNDGTHDLRFDGESKAVTPLSASWTYERTFSSAGTFAFYCTVHPKMTGSIVVLQASTTPPGGTTTPTGTTTSPTATTTTGTPSNAVASFDTSPKSLRASKTGRLKYTFRATALSAGKISLKSTKKLKIGSTTRLMKLAAETFTASSSASVKVTFKLSSKQLRALKRVKRLRFTVTVAVGAKTFTTKLTLQAPTTS